MKVCSYERTVQRMQDQTKALLLDSKHLARHQSLLFLVHLLMARLIAYSVLASSAGNLQGSSQCVSHGKFQASFWGLFSPRLTNFTRTTQAKAVHKTLPSRSGLRVCISEKPFLRYSSVRNVNSSTRGGNKTVLRLKTDDRRSSSRCRWPGLGPHETTHNSGHQE